MRPGQPPRPTRRVQQPAGNPVNPATVAAMSGAVDLGALKARNEAAARAAQAPAPQVGQFVIDVAEADFQAQVLDRSFQVPVLIDLWADWCEPCKQLSPILERLANADAGKWVLAKIDVEANPRIQQALQVQSIPSVFAVIGGQLVPGFQGALPEPQVREFIDAVLDAAAQADLNSPPESLAGDATDAEPAAADQDPQEPDDPRFTAAEDALEAGDYDLATQRYQDILGNEPANTEAQLALGQVRLLQRLETIEPDAPERADAAPDDVDAQLAAADLSLAANDVQGAFDRLIATVTRTVGGDRDLVRQRLLEFFDLLDPADPRVPVARRALARALF